MSTDRSLDEEGIPDLEGPLPEKAATGDPQEGASPPSDRPASLDYGVTAEEQRHAEPLDRKLARELPDEPGAPDDPVVLVNESDGVVLGLDEEQMLARDVDQTREGKSAEEAAVHVEGT